MAMSNSAVQPLGGAPLWSSVLWPFLALAGPMVVSRLGLAGMSLADGWMIARLSEDGSTQLAVWSLVDSTLGRALDIAVAFVMPGLALVAQSRAQGLPNIAAAVWRRALHMALWAGLIAMAVMPAMPWLLSLSPGAGAVSAQADSIATALAWGFVPALLALASAGYLEAMGRPLIPVVMVLLANLVNIGLNSLLISGTLWPGVAGAEGCAWATTAVRWLMAGVLTLMAWRMARRDGAGEHGLTRRTQVSRGFSSAAQSTLTQILSLITPLILAGLSLTLWAHWAALWLLVLPLGILSWGLADAFSLRLAAAAGLNDAATVRRSAWVLGGMCSAALALACLPGSIWPQALVLLLPADHALSADTMALWVALTSAGMVLDGLSSVLASGLRALQVLWSTLAVQLLCSAAQVLGLWVWSQSAQPELHQALLVVVCTAGLKLFGMAVLLQQRTAPTASFPRP